MRSSLRGLLKFSKKCAYIGEIEALKPDAKIFNSVVTCLSDRKLGNNVKKICFVRETFQQTIIEIKLQNLSISAYLKVSNRTCKNVQQLLKQALTEDWIVFAM